MRHRVSAYSPRQRQDSERKPISGAQRRRPQAGTPIGAIEPAEAGPHDKTGPGGGPRAGTPLGALRAG